MRICMFTNTYLPHVGGVARSVQAFTEDLRAGGHEVLVVCPEFPDSEEIDVQDPDVVRVPAIQEFNGSDFSVRLPVSFLENDRIEAFSPDILHSHHPFLMGDTALRIARQRTLPLVFTHHTMYEQYTHYVPFDSPAMQKFAVALATEYANLCSAVIAPSESIAEVLLKRGVSTPITAIPTGVDTKFFGEGRGKRFRNEKKIPLQDRVIGHLGRLAPEKNLEFLARAVAGVLQQRADGRFLVIGAGPDAQTIRDIFSQAGIADRLVMAGNQSGTSLRDAYSAMDLFVFASKSETQGMVLTEAMAAGRPVIALDAPGAREVVIDGRNGRLLPGEATVDQFCEAVRQALADENELQRWRQETQPTAERFSRRACVQRLLQLYGEVCEQQEAPHRSAASDLLPWDTLLGAVRAEYDLLAEKAAALVQTVNSGAEKRDER